MSNEYTPQHISPEQLAKVVSIIEEQKEKETMQNTWEKFQKELQEPTLCGACGQYYEENEQGDDGYHAPELCDANDEIKIRSLFVECREWFDKINGNTYFSARIWINGGQVAILPFQYGYGDQFIYEAQKKLLELGYLPQEGKNQSLYSIAENLGFDYYTARATTKKNEMFKMYENYQEKAVN